MFVPLLLACSPCTCSTLPHSQRHLIFDLPPLLHRSPLLPTRHTMRCLVIWCGLVSSALAPLLHPSPFPQMCHGGVLQSSSSACCSLLTSNLPSLLHPSPSSGMQWRCTLTPVTCSTLPHPHVPAPPTCPLPPLCTHFLSPDVPWRCTLITWCSPCIPDPPFPLHPLPPPRRAMKVYSDHLVQPLHSRPSLPFAPSSSPQACHGGVL